MAFFEEKTEGANESDLSSLSTRWSVSLWRLPTTSAQISSPLRSKPFPSFLLSSSRIVGLFFPLDETCLTRPRLNGKDLVVLLLLLLIVNPPYK